MKRHHVPDNVMAAAYAAAVEMYAHIPGFYVYRGGSHIAVGRDQGVRLMLATHDNQTTIGLDYY